MASSLDARAVACHEIQITIVTAKNRVGIMIAAGTQLVSDAAAVNEGSAGTVTFEELDAVSAYRKKPIAVNEQALRSTPAQARGDDFEAVENAVVIAIDQSPDGIAIAHEQASVAVERHRVTAPCEFRTGGAVNVESQWQLEAFIQKCWRCGFCRGAPPNECVTGDGQ
jgi:hypothetical protein